MEHEQLSLLEWLKNRAVLEESEYTQGKLRLAVATIERLQKERDDLSKRLERMHRPRCEGYSDDPEGPWPLLQNPCQFCGSRSESDACRDMADTADCDKIREERDAALAEVERLKARDEKQSSMIRQIDPLYR